MADPIKTQRFDTPLSSLRGLWPIILVLVGLALVPTLATAFDNPFLVRLFTRALIFAIVASALNFILGFGGLVSLMHAGLFGVGSYTVAILAFHDYEGSKFLIFPGTSNLAISIMEQARIEVLAGVNLPMLVKLASVRNRPIAEAVRMAQEAGRKYITVASRILAKEAS